MFVFKTKLRFFVLILSILIKLSNVVVIFKILFIRYILNWYEDFLNPDKKIYKNAYFA